MSEDNQQLHFSHYPKDSKLAEIVDNTVNFFDENLDLEAYVSGADHKLPVVYIIKSKTARIEPDTSYQLDPADDDKDITITDTYLTRRDFGNFRLLSNGEHFYLIDDVDTDQNGLPHILTANKDGELIDLDSSYDLKLPQKGEQGFDADQDIQYFYMAEKALNN